jgi:hypothetical protein
VSSEEDEEDMMCTSLKINITQSEGRKDHPTYSETKEG